MARSGAHSSAGAGAGKPSRAGLRTSTIELDPSDVQSSWRDSELITGEAVAIDIRATGFVLRAAGSIIDFLVYLGSYIALTLVITSIAGAAGLDDAWLATLSVVLLVLCIVVAPVTVELLSRGKSLGRLAVGARIVRVDGGAIALRHSLIRALIGIFEIFMTLGGIASLVALLNEKSQRVGDLVAGTYSQNERITRYEPPTFGAPTELVPWTTTADVARMPDSLARRVSQFLRQASALSPAARTRLATELASEVSRYVSPIPVAHPELFLAAVIVVRREREARALELERARLERLSPVLSGLPHGFPDR